MFKLLISLSLVVLILLPAYSQCSGTVFGPTEVCQGTSSNYFVSGLSGCSIQNVSGTGNTFSGSTVNWNAPYGSYQISFNCSCGEVTQAVEIADPANGSPGTISDRTAYQGDGVNLDAIGVVGTVLRWEMKAPDEDWTQASSISNMTTTLNSSHIDLWNTMDYRIVVTRCGSEMYSNSARVTLLETTQSICGNESVLLSFNDPAAISTAWFSEVGDLLTYGNSFQTPVLTTTTEYKVRTYDINGVATEVIKTVNVFPIETHQPAIPLLTKSGTDYLIDKNNPNTGVYTYEWVEDPNGVNGISGSPTITTDDYGKIYYIRAKNNDGCYGPAVAVQVPTDLAEDDFGVQGIDQDLSYLKTHVFKVKNIADPDAALASDVSTSINYVDGLGRPLQEVTKASSPDGNDQVVYHDYDALGRETKVYLPFVSNTMSGVVVNNPIDRVNEFYSENGDKIENSTVPYSFTSYDHSPQNRPLIQSSPGGSWEYLSGANVHLLKLTNTSVIKRFSVVELGAVTVTDYTEGKLIIFEVEDENGHFAREYQRLDGNVVLKEVESEDEFGNAYTLKTYYVYNHYGQLAMVVPPSAVKLIEDDSNDWSKINDDTFRDQWMFQYRYDGRGRMIVKKVPGADKIQMVYDQKDRLALTLDGNNRALNGSADYDIINGTGTVGAGYVSGTKYAISPGSEMRFTTGFHATKTDNFEATTDEQLFESDWQFTKYDALDRVTLIGHVTLTGSRAEHQNILDTSPAEESYIGSSGGHNFGYSNTSYPQVSESKVNQVWYYDDYNYQDGSWSDYNSSTGTLQIPGQETGGLVRLLDSNNPLMLKRSVHFDTRYRVKATVSEHHLGGFDKITNTYRTVVSDRLDKVVRLHRKTGEADLDVTETMTYDHADRMKENKHQITGQSEVILSNLDYNELGQLTDKDLHDGAAQNVDFRYNIRGWLKNINGGTALTGNDKFGLQLRYADAAGYEQYNGNIGSMSWISLDNSAQTNDQEQTYLFRYDESNRLKTANYESAGQDTYFKVSGITYDPNGNILSLKRRMGSTSLADDLTYTYANGNQLSKVDDAGNAGQGFEDGSNATNEYLYDANGNMIKDKNKGINTISYNFLNLPQTVTIDGGVEVNYIYLADGTKVRKETTEGADIDYLGGLHYSNDSKEFLQTFEGRFLFSNNTYEYNLTDHLGNVRVSVDETGDVVQRDDYYPFGLTFNSYTNGQENLYILTGNEEQKEWDVFDFNARIYDPTLGRFNSVDPLADVHPDWNPYRYAYNNPLLYSDPSGLLEVKDDRVTYNTEEEINAFFVGYKKVFGTSSVSSSGDSNGDSGNEEQNCPAGYNCKTINGQTTIYDQDGNIVYQNMSDYRQSVVNESLSQTLSFLEAAGRGAAEEVAWMVIGGTAIKLVFRGGKWVVASYRAYTASKNAAKLGIRAVNGGLEGSLKIGENIIDYTVETASRGSSLVISEIAVYPRGVVGNELAGKVGNRVALLVRRAVIEWARGKKLSRIGYQYTRGQGSSSAMKGRRAIEWIELN